MEKRLANHRLRTHSFPDFLFARLSDPTCIRKDMFFWIVKAIKKFKSSYPRTDLFLRRSLYLGDIFIKNLSDEKLELSEAVTRFF